MKQIWMLSMLVVGGVALAQDHSYTPGDLEMGRQAYRANCIGCHGAEGTSVAGIDLGRRKFRVATSDEDLIKIILNGLPGTGMPAFAIPPLRAGFIVGYMRVMNEAKARTSIAAARGDAERGKVLFRGAAGCAGCHRILGEGGRSGPDLTDVGHLMRPIEIEAALLDPDEQYPLGTRPIRVVKKSGATVTGLMLNQDTFSVELIDQEGALRAMDRAELQEVKPAGSWMPSYRGKLNGQELADVIAYLARQRGAK